MAHAITFFLLTSLAAGIKPPWTGAFGPVNQQPISGLTRGRPNIVFILTDDQDLHMQSLDYMPFVKKHLIEHGTFFRKHFCTTALCCPSRVSLWTGKAAHNTNVTNVVPPYGGYPKFISQGLNDKYLPVWLQDAGYNTYYTGKLFNAHADFLLDPFTYWYMNSTYQRNHDPPVSYEGQHTVDVLAKKAIRLLDEAYTAGKPFFLGLAPVAPHSDIQSPSFKYGNHSDLTEVEFSPPVPAKRHAHLFQCAKVPRTPNFNPYKPSGASWIRNLRQQEPDVIEYNDYFYAQRLRTLQSVDELVDSVVHRLDKLGILDNTYLIYSTDNGYHIGQHRLQPSKQCSFEEDINIPLIIRGPGVPKGFITDIVTTHTDLAPTLLQIAGAPIRDDFDGLAIPLTQADLNQARDERHEHVTVEHWGFASNEGQVLDWYPRLHMNNTYKAMRVIGKSYNLLYQVWCNNEHELYDLTVDPGQMTNLLHPDEDSSVTLLGLPLYKVVQRLDSLLFVLKSCRAQTCIRPWPALHPSGNVENLKDALSPRYDAFYETETQKIKFDRCEMGYILDAEGAQYEQEVLDLSSRHNWHEWT
ncbi:putative arylsulfatase [Rosellinia necatrix]|uniref:Arylsulfatase n=1 Tax=Rosellinia necatrix TaxID=77044 RepID=A0A1W2TAF3_ROSNE|nr:putative arylsulfatase [Rosellinia necatrix]